MISSSKTITEHYIGRQFELRTRVGISDISDSSLEVDNFSGIWDTGASNSSITHKVVKSLALEPIDVVETSTANGIILSNIYKIKIYLGNNIIKYVRATECRMDDVDILIGMDVIGDGDFAVSTEPKSGDTYFSYRTPSVGKIDFSE